MEKSALFVCLGNICRSTMAEGILRHLVKERGDEAQWRIDSAGTIDWNAGNPPDMRTMMTLESHNISDYHHKARVITNSDFQKFKYIFVMDHENLEDVNSLKPDDFKSKILLLGSFDYGNSDIIKDPFFREGSAHFEPLYQKCLVCCQNFLKELYDGKIP